MNTPDQRFAACFPITEASEGWHIFSQNIHDPGGATWSGMTQRAYDGYRRLKDSSLQDVRKATDDEIRDCFRHQYWDAVRGDELPAGVDLEMYDDAINAGPVEAIRVLQEALGVAVDGQFGLETFDALRQRTGTRGLIATIAAERVSFWRSLRTWRWFGKGWLARGQGVKIAALAMVGT